MNPTPPTIDAPERREAVACTIANQIRADHLLLPLSWDHFTNGERQRFLRQADAILTLLAASSGERIASSDEMLCEGCGKSINRGQFVHVYDDVGEVHVDCDQPNAFSDDPMAMVMVGDPMRRIAPSAKASSGEREKALEDAAEVVVGLRSRCGVETFTDRAQRQILMIAEEKIRALATPATVDEGKV